MATNMDLLFNEICLVAIEGQGECAGALLISIVKGEQERELLTCQTVKFMLPVEIWYRGILNSAPTRVRET